MSWWSRVIVRKMQMTAKMYTSLIPRELKSKAQSDIILDNAVNIQRGNKLKVLRQEMEWF